MFKSSIKRFVRSWTNQTQLQVTTTSVLIGTFTVLFMALALFQSLATGLQSYGSHIQMTAYLSDEHKSAAQTGITEKVKSKDGIQSVTFVSAKEAIENFKAKMSDHLPDMFFDKSFENPLPATLEIELSEELLERGEEAKIKALAESLKEIPGVEDVSFGFNWADQFTRVTRAFTMSGTFLILVLLLGGIFVIGNSVSQSIYQKRDEIEIMELFGATKRSITVPFVVEGILTGVLAGVFALILSAMAMLWLKAVVADEIGFIGLLGSLKPMGLGASIVALFVCALMGGAGAHLFVSRITTGWSAARGSQR